MHQPTNGSRGAQAQLRRGTKRRPAAVNTPKNTWHHIRAFFRSMGVCLALLALRPALSRIFQLRTGQIEQRECCRYRAILLPRNQAIDGAEIANQYKEYVSPTHRSALAHKKPSL